MDKRNYGRQLTEASARQILNRVCMRAKISKRIYLNLFRHSEATNSAKFMTEAQLRLRHGWSPTSKMTARYVHLVNADVDQAYLQHHGIKTGKEEVPQVPKICHICKMPNSTESTICNKCGKPLDLQKAIELEEKQNEKAFMANKIAAKILVQMLMTKRIPELGKDEMASLIESLNL